MDRELEDLSILCLMEVFAAKVAELIKIAGELTACLCAPCPPGEEGEVIAGEAGGVRVISGGVKSTAGAITAGETVVKGLAIEPIKKEEIAAIAAEKRGE